MAAVIVIEFDENCVFCCFVICCFHNLTLYFTVRGDERVIRSCGYEKYKKDCYKTVLEEYNT